MTAPEVQGSNTSAAKKNDAAEAGLILGLFAAPMAAFVGFVIAAGGTLDGAAAGSLLEDLGRVGDFALLSMFMVFPVVIFLAPIGLTVALVGLVRSEERGSGKMAVCALVLNAAACAVLIGFIAS